MDQTEARHEARRLNDDQPIPGLAWVATTACATRGQFEQGPDANVWTVTAIPTSRVKHGR